MVAIIFSPTIMRFDLDVQRGKYDEDVTKIYKHNQIQFKYLPTNPVKAKYKLKLADCSISRRIYGKIHIYSREGLLI